MSLKDQVAVVTGGGSGIGQAAVLALAEQGVHLVVGNRNEEQGEAVVAAAREKGVEAVFVRTDVSQPDQVAHLINTAVQKFGTFQLAFNNAGIEGPSGPLHELPLDALKQVYEVNVHGVLYAMKYQIPVMLKAGGGSIVNTSSILGEKPSANMSVYNASKFAVNGLSRTAALEYAAQKIRINVVSPGPIETPMLIRATGGDPQAFSSYVPMGRIGQAHEIANAVVWLLSDASSFVTGTILNVDGGGIAG